MFKFLFMLVEQRNCIVFSFCVCFFFFFALYCFFYIMVTCKFTLLSICKFLKQNKNKNSTAWVAPDLLETPAILSDTTVTRSAVNQEDLKLY